MSIVEHEHRTCLGLEINSFERVFGTVSSGWRERFALFRENMSFAYNKTPLNVKNDKIILWNLEKKNDIL